MNDRFSNRVYRQYFSLSDDSGRSMLAEWKFVFQAAINQEFISEGLTYRVLFLYKNYYLVNIVSNKLKHK